MRIYLSTTRNRSIVPFDHIPVLVGTIHKWLGDNGWHDQLSLYSFSWLIGGKGNGRGLDFPYGAQWFISAHDISFVRQLVEGIQIDPLINFGLRVNEVTIQETPHFGDCHTFTLASPVLVKRRDGDQVRHYVFSDEGVDELLTETLKTKLKKAGLDWKGVEVLFNREYPLPKTKLVSYNGIGNKASVCPITIRGTSEQIAFAWDVGVGNSTGIGFGALK